MIYLYISIEFLLITQSIATIVLHGNSSSTSGIRSSKTGVPAFLGGQGIDRLGPLCSRQLRWHYVRVIIKVIKSHTERI